MEIVSIPAPDCFLSIAGILKLHECEGRRPRWKLQVYGDDAAILRQIQADMDKERT